MRPSSASASAADAAVAERAKRNIERLVAPVSSSAKRHAAAEAKRAHEQGRTHSADPQNRGASGSSSAPGHHGAGAAASGGGPAAGGKRVPHRAAWCFFAPSSNRVIEGAHPSKSCYLMTAAVHDHEKFIPSAKMPTALLPQRDPRFTKVLPRDVRGDCDIMTPADREVWEGVQSLRFQFAPRHEATMPVRRLRDQSHNTLDNGYRQFVEKGDSRPLMSRIVEGEFYNEPLQKQPKPFSYLQANRRNVHVASAVMHHVRSSSAVQSSRR